MIERFVSCLDYGSYEDFYERFSITVPEGFNFAYDVVDELAREQPDERALVWCDEKGAEAVFSFSDMKRLSDQAAQVFQAAGLGKGDAVMLILKRRHEFWPALLALHKLGAVAIPATHLLTVKDLLYRCTVADIAAILCVDDEEVMARVDEVQTKLRAQGKGFLRYKAFVRSVHTPPDLDIPARSQAAFQRRMGEEPFQDILWEDYTVQIAAARGDFSRPAQGVSSGDIMLLYFTSGTTGMPKMVRHDFAYPLGHILTARYWQQVRTGSLHLTVADTGWAKAAWGKIYGQWICGATVFVYDYDRFDPPAMLDLICKHRITSFCAPPTVYRFFVKEKLQNYNFSALEHCSVAGEPLNPEIYEQFRDATGIKLREGYGQTELTVTLGTYPWLEPKPGSMGKPSPGYDIDLLRDDGSSCLMGEEGQIVVRTDRRKPPGMFSGYYRDDALTDQVWHDQIYYTGDIAWRDEDGYYWFVGRADDVIKSSGYRIGPFEVESALLEHPAVLECAVTGVPDPDRGTAVKATVILAKGWNPSDGLKTELQNHVKKITAPYKYPRIVEFVSELPKTISGKIRRFQIRDADID